MDAVGAASSIVALIEIAAKIGLQCAEYSIAVKNANEDIGRLQDEVNTLEGVLERAQQLCNDSDSRLLTSKEVLQSLKDCSSQLQNLHQKLKPKKRHKVAAALKFNELTWPLQAKEVDKIIKEFERYKSTLSLAFQVDQTALLQDMFTGLELDKLPSADGAAFDSFTDQFQPRCHKETRIELRQQIREWIKDPLAKRIFWLNGAAGSGKSTIARTVAQECSEQGLLGASFFFKRGEGDRGTASRLITTIASQLVRSVPLLRSEIRNAISAEPDISRNHMRLQYDKLIVQPLKSLESCLKSPLVFVIDALDECSDSDQIQLLIQLFARTEQISSTTLRVFFTSRPELPIRLGFKQITGTSFQCLVLHEISESIVNSDIMMYLREKMSHVQVVNEGQLDQRWPSREKLDMLVSIAGQLFISAATISRFIGDERFDPDEQLDIILKYRHFNQHDQLAATYQPILDSLLVKLTADQREKVVKEFQDVVGTIVVAVDSLSVASLSSLLHISTKSIVRRLNNLHSVLKVPSDIQTPIRLFHLSFRDYLIGISHETNPLSINKVKVHQQLARSCLNLLSSTSCLKQDICNIGKLGIAREDIDSAVIDRCIPPDVVYACRHLVYHIRESKCGILDGNAVKTFLEKHLLHWIEALSLLGRIYELADMIETLQSLVDKNVSSLLDEILLDARQFILEYRNIIDSSPLQVYSMILFTPETGIIRRLFASCIPKTLSELPQINQAWRGESQAIQGHTHLVWDTALSPDGNLFATASYDHTIKLWNLQSGTMEHNLVSHTREVMTVAFSSNGTNLASGSGDGTFKIWDTRSGILRRTVVAFSDSLNFLLFAPDDQSLLTCGLDLDKWKVASWSTVSYRLTYTPNLQAYINRAKFSPSGKLLALGLDTSEVVLVNNVSGAVLRTFSPNQLSSDPVSELIRLQFSFSSTDFLAMFFEGDSHLFTYSIDEETRCYDLEDDERTMAISHGGELLATYSHSIGIRIRDISSWSPRHRFIKLKENVLQIQFSQDDSKVIALYQDRVSICIINTEELLATFEHSLITGNCLMFMPRASNFLATSDGSNKVQRFDIEGGKVQYLDVAAPGCKTNHLEFSPDGKLVVVDISQNLQIFDLENGTQTSSSMEGWILVYLEISPDNLYIVAEVLELEEMALSIEESFERLITAVWSAIDGSLLWSRRANCGELPRSYYFNDQQLITHREDSGYRVLDLPSGQVFKTVELREDDPLYSTLCPSSQYIIFQSRGCVPLQTLMTRKSIESTDFNLNGKEKAHICYTKQKAAAFTEDGILILDIESGDTQIFPANTRICSNLVLSRVGDLLAYQDLDKIYVQGTTSCSILRTIPIEARRRGEERLSFIKNDTQLSTSRGIIDLQLEQSEPNSKQSQSIFIADEWIMIGMQRILWVPPPYRVAAADSHEDKLALGFASGRVLLFDPSAKDDEKRNTWLM